MDQFEELFTLCKDGAEREAYVNNLMTAISEEKQGPLKVVLTLRADFYHHCMQSQSLLTTLPKYQVNIGAMTQEEQREAIVGPAEQGGWEFEPGLVDLMLREVSDEPGALPLLSHALLATWERPWENTDPGWLLGGRWDTRRDRKNSRGYVSLFISRATTDCAQHLQGIYTVPSGAYVYSAEVEIPGMPLAVSNTGDHGAADAGKLRYSQTNPVAEVYRFNTTKQQTNLQDSSLMEAIKL